MHRCKTFPISLPALFIDSNFFTPSEAKVKVAVDVKSLIFYELVNCS